MTKSHIDRPLRLGRSAHERTWAALALFGSLGCGVPGPAGPPGKPGLQGPQGPQGAPGQPAAGDGPTIALALPSSAFLGRQVMLNVIGSGTHFAQGQTRIDLGDPNIKVAALQVAGPQLLVASLDLGPDDASLPATAAQPGPHDITVITDGDGDQQEQAVLSGFFQVQAPLQASGGPLQQGGVSTITLTDLDQQNQFSFNLQVAAPEDSGVSVRSSSCSSTLCTATVAVDVNAAATSPYLFVRGTTAAGTATTWALPSASDAQSLAIAPSAPVPLPLGVATSLTLQAGASQTYELNLPTGKQLLSFALANASLGSPSPTLSLLPASGQWGGALPTRSVMVAGTAAPVLAIVDGGGPVYAVLQTSSSFAGSQVSVDATSQVLSVVSAVTPSTDPTMPNTQIDLTQGPNYLPGVTFALNQTQVFQFTAPRTGTILVLTGLESLPTNMELEVLNGTCAAGPLLTEGFGTASISATQGNTYCVKVVPEFVGTGTSYSLLLDPS